MNLGGWWRMEDPAEIYPLDDLRPHEEGSTCWCRPEVFVDWNGDEMLAHNALDQRERHEDGAPLH